MSRFPIFIGTIILATLVTSCTGLQVSNNLTEQKVEKPEQTNQGESVITSGVYEDEFIKQVDEWTTFPNLDVPDGWAQDKVYEGAEVYTHGNAQEAHEHPDELEHMNVKLRIYEGECNECLAKNFNTKDEFLKEFEDNIIGEWHGWGVSESQSCPECGDDDDDRNVFKYWCRNDEGHWLTIWLVEYPQMSNEQIEWVLGQWFADGKNDDVWEVIQ